MLRLILLVTCATILVSGQNVPLHTRKVEDGILPVDTDTSYLLPTNTKPISYDIELTTNIHLDNIDFSGNVKIVIDVIQATDTITIHAHENLTISEVKLDGAVIPSTGITKDLVRQFLIIKTTPIILQGTKPVLEISYTGELRTDQAGFYKSTYTDGARKG